MESIDDLKARIRELELQLDTAKRNEVQVTRPKIEKMSAEVVDSNPYRYFTTSNMVYYVYGISIIILLLEILYQSVI